MVGHQKRAPKTRAFENGPQSGVFFEKAGFSLLWAETEAFEYDNFIHNTTRSSLAHFPDTPCLPLRTLSFISLESTVISRRNPKLRLYEVLGGKQSA